MSKERLYKTKQIIPAECLFAKFKYEKVVSFKKIICYSLLVYKNGFEEIVPMCINESGEIFNPLECDDFEEITDKCC